ncbi:MAG: LPXTG cell wall anchor domain-containing protein, partial [Oscillospiraceae bacterium]
EETASEETASEETASEETASEETASEETASNEEDDDDTVRIYGTITSTDSGSQLKEKSEAAPQDGEKIASEKLEIGLDGSFIIEEGWKYEIVITYDRTVSEPETPPGENHNPPGEGAGGPDRNIRTINEPEVPLANTPPETKTIIDEDVPLGNLPTAGGNGSKAMAKAGGLMLLVGSLLRVVTKKRKQDDE